MMKWAQDSRNAPTFIAKRSTEAEVIKKLAPKYGVTIRSGNCQDCINDAYLQLRSIFKKMAKKQGENTQEGEQKEPQLTRTEVFLTRKYPIANPLVGLPVNGDKAKKHPAEIDKDTPDEVLADIIKYNPTGFLPFFSVK